MAHQPGGRVVQWATRLLGMMAALFLFAMMWLTFIDVWGRYLLNTPVPGGFEITELMMATLIFAGLPLVTLGREHVTVDFVSQLMPSRMREYVDAVITAVCAVMMGVLAYRMWIKAVEQFNYGDQTAALNIPVAPVSFFMCAAITFTCLLQVILSWDCLNRAGKS